MKTIIILLVAIAAVAAKNTTVFVPHIGHVNMSVFQMAEGYKKGFIRITADVAFNPELAKKEFKPSKGKTLFEATKFLKGDIQTGAYKNKLKQLEEENGPADSE